MLKEILLLVGNLDRKEINNIKITIFFIIISTIFKDCPGQGIVECC